MEVQQPLANYTGSPQIEDGHTKIANELLDAIIQTDFSKRQYKILLYIMRKTYGWNKTEDDIARSQIVEATKLKNPHVTTTIQELLEMNVLIVSNGKFAKRYKINKHYDTWRITEKVIVTKTVNVTETVIVTETVTDCYQNGNFSLPKQYPQKTTPKDNTKDNNIRATRLSDDWVAPQEYIDFCNSERPDLNANLIAEQFKDYWISVPGSKGLKRNWLATWRNWVRNQKQNQSIFKNKSQVISDEKFEKWLYKPDGKKYL
jgi:phage replication O-like protein O